MKPALAFVLLLCAAPAFAAGTAAPPHPPIQAVRLAEAVNIDGVLDEPIWQSAQKVTDFYQSTPDQGEKASQRTEVRIAYDDDALYVGARLLRHGARLDPRAPVAARRVGARRPVLGLPRSATTTSAAATTSW